MEYSQSTRTIFTTDLFDAWFAALRDRRGKARIEARLRRVEQGHWGDVKPVGEGVSELRIHAGPGYRVYLTRRGQDVVVLLAGGDKDSQVKDIKAALELARRL
jgi:putative addiction module killer protein